MINGDSILVSLVRLVDAVPFPPSPTQRKRGRQQTYSDQLIVKAVVVRLLERITSTTLRTREETVIPLAMEGLRFQLQGGQLGIRHFLARRIDLLIQHGLHR